MKKGILVETGVGKSVSDTFSRFGYQVERLDAQPDPGDAAILARAYTSKRVLVTEDQDFGEHVYRDKKPHHGIILIENTMSKHDRLEKISYLLTEHESALNAGAFIRINSDGIRIRHQQNTLSRFVALPAASPDHSDAIPSKSSDSLPRNNMKKQ
jgi:predicted nuclease of predicted toxin-antitoxin system